MSDIFDEVDDILSEVNVDSEMEDFADIAVDSSDAEKNFNESELQDIMAEIENLEKEYETVEVKAAVAPIQAPTKQNDLQNEIDREIEMSMIEKEEADLDMVAPKVLSFEKKSTSTSMPATSSEISFEAHGQMNLNLGFKIGDENAQLTIDPVKGLIVTMKGVELCINREEGCKVTMENGVKFTIPLTSAESNLKKKSA